MFWMAGRHSAWQQAAMRRKGTKKTRRKKRNKESNDYRSAKTEGPCVFYTHLSIYLSIYPSLSCTSLPRSKCRGKGKGESHFRVSSRHNLFTFWSGPHKRGKQPRPHLVPQAPLVSSHQLQKKRKDRMKCSTRTRTAVSRKWRGTLSLLPFKKSAALAPQSMATVWHISTGSQT